MEQPTAADDAPPPVVRIPLRAPPFWSATFTLVFGAMAVVMGSYFLTLLPGGAQSFTAVDFLLHLGLPFTICGVALGLRQLTRPREVPPLQFYDDHLEAPRSAESRRGYKIAYDDILSVDLRGRGPAERLFIGTRRRLLALPRPAFERPDAVEQVLKELYVRILRRPQGSRIVEEIARRRRAALAALSHPPLATHLLLVTMAVAFGLEFAGGAFEQAGLGQVRFGANAPLLVQEGEVWRLLASLFLHTGLLHLYFSGLTLFFVGGVLERLLGRSRFVIIFMLAGLGGSLAAALFSRGMFTVGSSGAVVGLFGAYAVVSLRYGPDLPVGLRQPWRWWLVVGFLQLLLPFIVPALEYITYAGSLVLGIIATLLVVDPKEALNPEHKSGAGLRVMAAALGLLTFASVATGFGEALRRDRDGVLRFARHVLESPAADPDTLNALAWTMALDKKAGEDALRLARLAAQRSIDETPKDAVQDGRSARLAVIDTRAAVDYRLGQWDDAIAAGRQVLETEPGSYYASHLATYLGARMKAMGEVAVSAPELEVRAEGQEIVAVAKTALPEGLTAYVLALVEAGPKGLIRLELGAGEARQARLPAGMPLDPAARYHVAWFERRCACEPNRDRITSWPLPVGLTDLP